MPFLPVSPASLSSIERSQELTVTFSQFAFTPEEVFIWVRNKNGVEEELVYELTDYNDEVYYPGFSVRKDVSGIEHSWSVSSAVGWVGEDLRIRASVKYSSVVYNIIGAAYVLLGDDGGYDPPTTVVEDGVDLFLQQFHGLPHMEALLSSYLEEVQTLQRVAYDLVYSRNLDTATGGRLDGIGEILNVDRGLLNDPNYRQRLKAELAVLKSNGTTDELINILYLLLNLATPDILLNQYYPETVFLRARNHQLVLDPEAIEASLQRAVASGFNIQFIYSIDQDDDDDMFRLSDTTGVAETGVSHGFGNGTLAGVT